MFQTLISMISFKNCIKCLPPRSLSISNLISPSMTKNQLHQPGIEPGSVPWQGTILPLDHWCCCIINYKYTRGLHIYKTLMY